MSLALSGLPAPFEQTFGDAASRAAELMVYRLLTVIRDYPLEKCTLSAVMTLVQTRASCPCFADPSGIAAHLGC